MANKFENTTEGLFLEGPRTRRFEIISVFRIALEFIKGFRKLHFVGPCVTVFGSARFGEEHRYYHMAREVGASISKLGFTVLTGGGPGIMEAANRGAYELGAPSVGCNIELPFEQKENVYLHTSVTLRYFFVRKVLLQKYSYAFVVMPGGSGTMDELFEMLTLIQTGKIRQFPIVIMGKDFWQPLLDLLDKMVIEKTISPEDLEFFLVTDSVEEAVAHIEKNTIDPFGLIRSRTSWKPRRLLGEHLDQAMQSSLKFFQDTFSGK
jgi:uncharacterized protein (TIGR00730 family)